MPTSENVVAFFKKRGFNILQAEVVANGFRIYVEGNSNTEARMRDIWSKTQETANLAISVVAPKPLAVPILAPAEKPSLWRRFTAWVLRRG